MVCCQAVLRRKKTKQITALGKQLALFLTKNIKADIFMKNLWKFMKFANFFSHKICHCIKFIAEIKLSASSSNNQNMYVYNEEYMSFRNITKWAEKYFYVSPLLCAAHSHLKARDIITTATALGENDQLVNQPAGRSSNVLPAHSAIFEREKCRCGSVWTIVNSGQQAAWQRNQM